MQDTSILLVEDNPDDALLTQTALKESQFLNTVIWVKDGVEALDYLFSNGRYVGRDKGMPKLVLLDLKLPRLDGLDVLRRIRADERTRLLPVVVLTTSSEQRDIIESYRLGANSFVHKPVDFSEFVDAARKLGTYWLSLNQGLEDRR